MLPPFEDWRIDPEGNGFPYTLHLANLLRFEKSFVNRGVQICVMSSRSEISAQVVYAEFAKHSTGWYYAGIIMPLRSTLLEALRGIRDNAPESRGLKTVNPYGEEDLL